MAIAAKNDPHLQEGLATLNCSENPAVKKLLDAIVSILAEEYIQTAKNNPEIFS